MTTPYGEAINDHGDVLIRTTGLHGGDISSQRVDDLDQACLEFLALPQFAGATPVAIDVGGGLGGQSSRMAQHGAEVWMIDLTDQSENISTFNAVLGRQGIRFFQSDARTCDISEAGPIDVVYSQRMLSCIPYSDARLLMRRIYE